MFKACVIRALGRSKCTAAGEVKAAPLQLGEKLAVCRSFSDDELRRYSDVSGDSNPIHTDPHRAQAAGFRGCVVHGMLTAGLFPAIIGSGFPGAIYVSQTLKFHEPAIVNEKLVAEVVVKEMIKLKRHYKVVFDTSCSKHEVGSVVVDGTAVALIPS